MIAISPLFDLLPSILQGLGVTLKLTILGSILAVAISFIAGLGRLSKYLPVRMLSGFYIEFFRGTSLLVQLFWMFFVLPFFGIRLSALTVGVLALGLNVGSYGSEVVRGGILSVPKEQTEAAIALNMSPWQRMRHVVLPQAFLIMLPSFGSLLVLLIKATPLVSLIALADLTFHAMQLRSSTGQTIEIFGLLLVLYFALAYPVTLGTRWLERKLSNRGEVSTKRSYDVELDPTLKG